MTGFPLVWLGMTDRVAVQGLAQWKTIRKKLAKKKLREEILKKWLYEIAIVGVRPDRDDNFPPGKNGQSAATVKSLIAAF